MSLFRNPNEKLYPTGKKTFVTVIKNRGSSELLIWRQPEEDFNTKSTLIVMPGEVAVFIKGGVIQNVFESGTYKLTTKNYPFLSRIKNAFSGGVSAYNCVVYFLRKSDSQELRWGTSSPIQVMDKFYNIRTEAKARGIYKICIKDAEKFIEKLAGNLETLLTQEDLDNYFSSEFQSKIKSEISRLLNSLNTPLIGLDTHLDSLSESIKPKIDELLNCYGLSLVNFVISGLDIEKNKYDAIDKSQLELIAKQREAHGKRAEIDILGENWSKQQSFEILRAAAENSSPGGIGNLATEFSVGVATANVLANMANQNLKIDSTTNNKDEPFEKLSKLKQLLDAGLITPDEYEAKKTKILSEI